MIDRSNLARHRGLIGILTLTLLCSGCQNSMADAAEHAAIAEAQLGAGDLAAARESIQLAILERDDEANYFILLGRIELQAQKLPSAFNAFSRALDLQADNLEVLQAIAELGLQTGRVEEAGDAADRILLLFPGSPRALLVKGFVAIENGQLEDADQYASQILEANPADEGGAILSARLSALRGRFDDATGIVLRARSSVGETDALNATLLEIYRAKGDAAGMRSVFPQVIATTEADSDYRFDYINFLYKTGNATNARVEALKAIEAKPNDQRVLNSLNALFLEYDRTPFTASQLSLINRSGTRATRLSLALFYFSTKQFSLAQNLLQQLVSQDVREAQALQARILLASGKTSGASKLIDAVLKEDPRNPNALLARSASRLREGRIDAALEDANVVVSDAPQEYEGYAALAKAHLAKGSELRARQVFEQGMNQLPQSALLAERYEAFLRQNGELARIVSLYGDLAVAKPSSDKAWETFTRVCAELGDLACKLRAQRGLADAGKRFVIDEPPGTPRTKGLFSRITPEQICRSTGGICTGT